MRHRLGALLVVGVLVAALGPTSAGAATDDATVTATAAKVDVRTKRGAKFAEISKTKAVRVGNLVRTDDTGLAQVDYGDGSYTRLDHNTKFQIKKLTDDAGDRQVKTTLISGQTFNRVEKLTESESFVQSTAGVAAAVLGTTFAVARDPDAETSTFTLIEGTLTLKVRGVPTPVTLTAGQRVAVTEGFVGPVETLTPEALCTDAWICANQEAFATAEAPAPTTVPFAMRGSGSLSYSGGSINFSGSVTGTPVGSGSFSGGGTVGTPVNCPNSNVSTTDTTITANTGDTITVHFTGTSCLSSARAAETSGTFTVTGGTGRFVNASGSGSASAHAAFSTPSSASVTLEFEGTITIQPPS